VSQPVGGWGLNIGGLIQHYRPMGWLIRGSTGPFGWTATLLDEAGRPKGRPLAALTLDELAAMIDAG
jgi:hypothetical protein